MEELVLILLHWMTMETGNPARLLRLLRLAHALLSCLFDCFTGRHWAFLCSCIHAVFSCHFTAVPSFFVDHPSSSIDLFAMHIPFDDLRQLIDEVEFANYILRELISFHQFQHVAVHPLLISLNFSAADLLTILLFKFSRDNTVTTSSKSLSSNWRAHHHA